MEFRAKKLGGEETEGIKMRKGTENGRNETKKKEKKKEGMKKGNI